MEGKMSYDYEELIRSGAIDITTREAVENETDKSQRDMEPDAYTLTYDEAITILRANNIVETVIIQNNFTKEDKVTGKKIGNITPENIPIIINAITQRGLDPDEIYNLADRVLSGNWYTLLISSNRQQPGYMLISNVSGRRESRILTVEEYPKIYEGSTRNEQRKILRLPKGTGFLFSAEVDILETLHHVCNRQISIEHTIAAPMPKEIVYPKDAVTQRYFSSKLPLDKMGKVKMSVGDGEAYALVLRQRDPAPVLSLTNLPDGVSITGQDKITEEHNEIFNIICSYSDAGKNFFTDSGICKTMYRSNTADQRNRINEIIVSMMPDIITIDTGTMGDYYNFERKKIKGYVLPVEILEETVGNQHGTSTSRIYHLLKEPIFLTYGKMLNQVVRYPREAFNTPVNKTLETISLHFYLLDRISAIPRISNRIVYDTIFEHLNISGTGASANNKKANIRNRTRIILKTWKDNGYIKGWHEETKEKKRVKLDNQGKAKRGISSYCIVIEGNPTLKNAAQIQ